MTTLLHLDTSGDTGTVFCTIDGQIAAIATNTANRDHAATINLMIAEVLEKAGSSLKAVDAIAVCAGPGSYTGLRIGLATAKGLCYATGAKLMLHQKLVLLMHQLQQAQPGYAQYAALLPARQGEYFIAAMDATQSLSVQPEHISQEQLDAFLASCKEPIAITVEADFIQDKPDTVSFFHENILQPEAWAAYSYARHNDGHFDDLANSEPFYMKQPFVTQSKKGLL